MSLTDGKIHDVFKELINIGVGKAVSVLNDMIQMEIELEVPDIQIATLDKFRSNLLLIDNTKITKVTLEFEGALNGFCELIVPYDNAKKITSILIDEQFDSPELNMAVEGTVTELGNILLNGVMGTFSNVLDMHLDYIIPSYHEENLHNYSSTHHKPEVSLALVCKTKFYIDTIGFDGTILVIFRENDIDTLEWMLQEKLDE